MSTHNIGFYEEITKIIVQLSPNTHLTSSSETAPRGAFSSVCTDCYFICFSTVRSCKLLKFYGNYSNISS